MHYLKRMTRKNGEDGVSPVVGVMLMLVVTIIIAAVVSGFAGGLLTTKQKAPSVALDASIANGGNFANSHFSLTVLGNSQDIPTNQLKLVTSWSKNGYTNVTTVSPGSSVGNYTLYYDHNTVHYVTGAPWGYGTGLNATDTNALVPDAGSGPSRWGNYSLTSGTIIYAYPAGQTAGWPDPTSIPDSIPGYGTNTPYQYQSWTYAAGSEADGMQTVLGNGWEQLRTGDVVEVKLIYIPSGATIFDKNVVVS